MHSINIHEIKEIAATLRAGERVLLSGTVYTARDAAHKRFFELLDRGEKLPFNLEGAVIYYTGPTPPKMGRPVGACGPTTSARMNKFAPRLIDLGLSGIIGKGEMSKEVSDALARNSAIYFCAVGGAGALIASHVETAEVIAYEDLGCESVKRLTIKNLPLTVAIDASGGNIFQEGRKKYEGCIL